MDNSLDWKAYKPKGSNGYWYVGGSGIVCYSSTAEQDAKLIEEAVRLYFAIKTVCDLTPHE